MDGRKGFPEAIAAVFPRTEVQLCSVHLVRHSLNYGGYKQRKIASAWRRNWAHLAVFCAYPPEIRRVIYTTNASESTNMGVRKAEKYAPDYSANSARIMLERV